MGRPDYRLGGSVFVRQYAQRLEIVSPGGFPPGIGPENIIDQQNPRNRRIAEALVRVGLVERSGQGLNIMVETAIRQGKPLPNFARLLRELAVEGRAQVIGVTRAGR